MKVAVFGLGYVGSVTAAALARDGHEVVGVDPAASKVEAIRAGRAPVLEPGLDELTAQLVDAGRLRATDDPAEALGGAHLSLLCVGTPSRPDGSLDLRFVRQVAEQIGSKLSLAEPGHVVVVRSTVLPGSTREQVIPAIEQASGRRAGEGWDVAVNPEFLREGTSLEDYDRPSRILVGERANGIGARVMRLYEGVAADRFIVPLEVAEAVKYTDNAFHALKIAFANEAARVWATRGADPKRVLEIFAADTKLNASPAYLKAGFAFGGSCLPKDLRALTSAAREAHVRVPLLDAVLPSNEVEVLRAIEAVMATGKRRVALLGLAFKAGTDDLRESPLLELAERLLGKGFELAIHDPAVNLARLHGSNRAFLEEHLPHIERLLQSDLEATVAAAEVVVIGHGDARLRRDEEWRAAGKIVVRLVMRLLVLSSRPPWPPTRADQMTVERMLRFLAARGVEVDLACFVENEAEDRALRSELGTVCRRIATVKLPRWRSYARTALSLPGRDPMQVAYYRSPEMARLVAERALREHYDLVYVHLIRMAEYARGLALPKVIGLQVSQALNLQRMVEHATDPARRLFYRVEANKVRPYEAALCRDFDRVFVVGARDVEELAKSGPVPNALVQPHGQDVPPLARVREAKREPGAIVLSGVMATYTNVNAARWFAQEIFPLVEREAPNASFWIVGRQPQREVLALARPPRVVVTGEVPDVYEWLCRAEVGVAPLRIGAGMQNKLVQAMASELPVVATTVANEGIGATPETHLLLRDEPQAFADAVLGLLHDPAARERLGRSARRFVESHWTWEAHFEKQLRVFAEVAAGGA